MVTYISANVSLFNGISHFMGYLMANPYIYIYIYIYISD